MNDKLYLKKWREDRWYNGNRELAIQRDGSKCVKCGKTSSLDVHHKDFMGRGYTGKINNDLTNLETLCDGCHRKAHAKRERYLLKVAGLWDKSNREVGRQLKISHTLVGEIKKELLSKILTGNDPFYMVRRTDGVYRANKAEERE